MNGSLLYVGYLWHGSTSAARMLAIQALGIDVLGFNVSEHISRASWLENQLASRFCRGPLPKRLTKHLLDVVSQQRTRLRVIWIDKGLWIDQRTLTTMRELTGAKLVHYTPDPQVMGSNQRLSLFREAVPNYDVVFTTKPFEVPAYQALGPARLELVQQSYCDAELAPRDLTTKVRHQFASEICFVGRHERQREQVMADIVRRGHRLRIWGPHWRRQMWRLKPLRPAFAGDGLYGADYAAALNSTSIALCLLSKLIPDTTTTRSFEIPGCGAFMLAERTADHQALFDEGQEAEFFSSSDEMCDKIQFYLANDSARRRIAAAGHARCLRSGYGDRARMRQLLTTVDSLPATYATRVA
jgi:spore maturation protein CgeB